jgi:hypothetical protein
MQGKKILSTKKTPEIILNPEGMIKIKGRSMNGDMTDLSRQMEIWVDEYFCDPAELTCVDIYLEYFNEVNLYVYISLLKKIKAIELKNKKYIINWYYEEGDEDILEKGENISFILNIPFNFIKIDDPSFPCSETVTDNCSGIKTGNFLKII